jgi:hypothetical protein
MRGNNGDVSGVVFYLFLVVAVGSVSARGIEGNVGNVFASRAICPPTTQSYSENTREYRNLSWFVQ